MTTQFAPAQTHPASTLPATLTRIVLTGFMGAGKSAVGRLTAEALDWQFLDLDSHLEARTGSTIPGLFAQLGEAGFRRLESTALANALRQRQVVLALGGGTPEPLTNRLLLEQTPGSAVTYLHAPFSTLYDRCLLQQWSNPTHVRPLLRSPAEAEARFQLRDPFYRRISRNHLDTATLNPEQAAVALLATLASASLR